MKKVIKSSLLTIGIFLLSTGTHAHPDEVNDGPKIVVGIVVDQMRAEYLNRYYDKFEEGGFKRLLKEGFNNKNTHYNYIPTKTGPGHASVYTGTTPAIHGIIGNSWYDRGLERMLENIEDVARGVKSPENMLTTTITDELQLSNQGRSKVIGVSIKDRGAILPAGHMGDGAYWYDGKSGNMISSNYYQDAAPAWVDQFNGRKVADSLLNLTWNTLLPIEQYTESGPDNTRYERIVKSKKDPVFPYNLKKLRKDNGDFGYLPETPFGNTITTKFAIEAIKHEALGKGDYTDFIAVSYSSTDKIGHAYGPQSVEVQDTYIRLDRELAELLSFLDNHVGEGNYLLFLTADHAAMDVANFSLDNKIPAGIINASALESTLNDFLNERYGQDGLIDFLGNEQIYLNDQLINEKGLEKKEIEKALVERLMQEKGIARAFRSEVFKNSDFETGIMGRLQRGYNHQRSGDVLMVFLPNWAVGQERGTDHSSGYTYDTHVPLLWYGWNVKPGKSYKEQSITDIAATLSMMLDIKFPSGCIGQPILEVLE